MTMREDLFLNKLIDINDALRVPCRCKADVGSDFFVITGTDIEQRMRMKSFRLSLFQPFGNLHKPTFRQATLLGYILFPI